jgi:hypothetical protein
MDRFRVVFKCNQKPDERKFLGGYEKGKNYIGRSFNGLFQISPKWGSSLPTRVIPRKVFDQYFELIHN